MEESEKIRSLIGQLRKRKLIMRVTSLVFALSLLNVLFSCSYFKVKEIDSDIAEQKEEQIKRFNQEQKYFVIHSNENQFHLDNVQLDSEKELLTGQLLALSSRHLHKKDPNVQIGKTYRYKSRKTDPLNEIHIYLKNDQNLEPGNTSIPISAVDRIAVVDKNVGRTIIYAVGSTIGVLALAMVIIALTKSSCPFIYTYDGENYVFNGELYPGNIIKNAQQVDYLKIDDICQKDGYYQIKVSNELLEVQHTDLVEMLIIDHFPEHEVLLDPSGKPIHFENKLPPEKAFTNGKLVTDLISFEDENHFVFDQTSAEEANVSSLTLNFSKPELSRNASLYLRLKNSMWLDYVFGKFNEKFGTYYNSFQKQQQDFTLKESREWQESQHIPLNVYLKRNGEWKLEQKIFSTGPMAFREIGLNLRLDGIQTEMIEIKLETGFMFWEVDHVAINYPTTPPPEISSVLASKAVTGTGIEVSQLINKIDGQYLTQKNPGEYVELFYEASPIPKDYERSIFIKNKGYYNYIRDYQGIPDLKELLKFKQAGYFTQFSKTEFENIQRIWETQNSSEYAL